MGVIIGYNAMPDPFVAGLIIDGGFMRKADWLDELQIVAEVAMPGAIVSRSSDPQWDAFLRLDAVSPDNHPNGVTTLNRMLAEASLTAFEPAAA